MFMAFQRVFCDEMLQFTSLVNSFPQPVSSTSTSVRDFLLYCMFPRITSNSPKRRVFSVLHTICVGGESEQWIQWRPLLKNCLEWELSWSLLSFLVYFPSPKVDFSVTLSLLRWISACRSVSIGKDDFVCKNVLRKKCTNNPVWPICVCWRLSQFKLVTALRGNGNDYKCESAFLYFKTRTQSKQTQNKRHKYIILRVCTGTNAFPDALCIRKKRKRLEGVSLVELARFKTNCT